MISPLPTESDVIYSRTAKGQAAALFSRPRVMDKEDRRLLLMVNGFTSLNELARVGHFESRPQSIAEALAASGLIECTKSDRQGSAKVAIWGLA